MLQETEKGFQQAIVDYAKLNGWSVYHTFDSRRSEPGFPDLIMLRHGEQIVAEVKSAKGKLTNDQRGWLDAFAACPHCETYLWRPEHWDYIVARLSHGVSAIEQLASQHRVRKGRWPRC